MHLVNAKKITNAFQKHGNAVMVFVPNDDSVMDLAVTTMGIAIFRRARNVFGKGALPKIGHRPLDIVKTGMTVAVARCVRAEGASV